MHIAIVAVIILAAIVLVLIDRKRLKQTAKTVATDATNTISDVETDAVSVATDAAKEVEKI